MPAIKKLENEILKKYHVNSIKKSHIPKKNLTQNMQNLYTKHFKYYWEK